MEKNTGLQLDKFRGELDATLPYVRFFKRKLARLIAPYGDIFFPIFRKARPSFFRVLQRMTKVFNVTSLKYGKYDITNEEKYNNKRLIDRAK